MAEDFLVGTSCFFEFVNKEGELVEGAVVVDSLCQGFNGGRKPGGVEGDGVEGIAEDVTEKSGLGSAFRGIIGVRENIPNGVNGHHAGFHCINGGMRGSESKARSM